MGSNKFNAISIKNDYLEKYGFVNSAKRLAKIINRIEGHKKYRYVAYTDFRKYLQAII